MARHKNSDYNITEGLDFSSHSQDLAQEVQDVQHVQYVQYVQEEAKVNLPNFQTKEIGSTQGKKGQKLKRINMAFSDANHEYITKESRRQGMSSTAFVNLIIDSYRRAN